MSFKQNNDKLSVTVPTSLIQPKVTEVVLEIDDEKAKVIDETLQQEDNGSIKLPVSKCELAIRGISYDYDTELTYRWGENVKHPGVFYVESEDTGDFEFTYNQITSRETLELNAKELLAD